MAADQFGNYIVGIGGNYTGSGSSTDATQRVFFSSGDPAGSVSATRPAIAYDAMGGLYVKTDAGSGTSGWETRISPAE